MGDGDDDDDDDGTNNFIGEPRITLDCDGLWMRHGTKNDRDKHMSYHGF